MEQLNLDNNHFSIKIGYLFGSEDDFKVSLIGWQDGDYFKELSEEDGGVNAEHYQIFKNLPLGKKVDRKTLYKIIERFQQIPYLTSHNGNYKFHYDLHIWSKKYYIVYNSYLKKLCIKKLNILDKIFYQAVQPSWQI